MGKEGLTRTMSCRRIVQCTPDMIFRSRHATVLPPSLPLRSDSNGPLILLSSFSSPSNYNALVPALPSRRRSQSASHCPQPLSEMSAFARDFYTAGGRVTGVDPERELGSDNDVRRARDGGGKGGGVARAGTRYAPPGAPPAPRKSLEQSPELWCGGWCSR